MYFVVPYVGLVESFSVVLLGALGANGEPKGGLHCFNSCLRQLTCTHLPYCTRVKLSYFAYLTSTLYPKDFGRAS